MQKTKAQVSYLKQNEALPGGKKPVYLSNNLIRFDDHNKLKEEETFGIDGTLVDIGLVKSRTNKSGKFVTLVFNQEVGFDPDLSLFIFLKEKKRVNGAGAFLYIDDRNDIKFSQKKFKEKLNELPELRQIFMNAVLEELKQMINLENHYEDSFEQCNITNNIINELNSLIA